MLCPAQEYYFNLHVGCMLSGKLSIRPLMNGAIGIPEKSRREEQRDLHGERSAHIRLWAR